MKIWQVYDSFDSAQSDSFHPTKKAMLAHVKGTYGVRGPGKPDKDGWLVWEDPGDPENGHGSCEVFAIEIELKPTRANICDALKRYPMR